MRKEIRDDKNLIIGWVNDIGNQIQAQHRLKGIVGFYNKSSGITFQQNGKIFCYGDGTDCLVRLAEMKII